MKIPSRCDVRMIPSNDLSLGRVSKDSRRDSKTTSDIYEILKKINKYKFKCKFRKTDINLEHFYIRSGTTEKINWRISQSYSCDSIRNRNIRQCPAGHQSCYHSDKNDFDKLFGLQLLIK